MHMDLGTQPYISKLWCTPRVSHPLFNNLVLVYKRGKKLLVCSAEIIVMIRVNKLLPGHAEISGRKQLTPCICPLWAKIFFSRRWGIKSGNQAKTKKTCWSAQSLSLKCNPNRFFFVDSFMSRYNNILKLFLTGNLFMSSSTCELNANGPRLSRVSSKRDAGAVAASLPHVLAIATTARVCQLRCCCHGTSPQNLSLTHTVRGHCAA